MDRLAEMVPTLCFSGRSQSLLVVFIQLYRSFSVVIRQAVLLNPASNAGPLHCLLRSHVHNAPDAVPCLHVTEGTVDLSHWLPMRDELVHLEFAIHVVVHQFRHLRPSFDASKGAPLPHTSCHQLES